MAEAVAAFGLAANILQFIEFTSTVVTNFKNVYAGGRDELPTVKSIELAASDLQVVLQNLHVGEKDNDLHDPGFQKLASDCNNVAQELLDVLASIKSGEPTASKLSAWKTILKAKWKEEDINRLQSQLDVFRSELMFHLVSNLRAQVRKSEDQQTLILRGINEILQSNQCIKGRIDQQLMGTEELGARVIDMVVSRIPPHNRAQEKEQLERRAINNLLKLDDTKLSTEPQIYPQRYKQLTQRILVRLNYQTRQDRVVNILDAHTETFKWIFEENNKHTNNWASLPQWLESDSQLYWVTGKAGSGKSTLMKHIAYAPENSPASGAKWNYGQIRSHPHLLRWAPAPLKLLVATHFFWNSGAVVQMTQIGLLRSLLHQILSQDHTLIPKAAPIRWEALCIFGADLSPEWTLSELLTMFRSTIAHLKDDTRLCLFIDGLDEFNGNHSILTNLCKELVENPKIKLCVASRPWDVFERAFEQEANLRMENLTHDDIHAYVTTELTASPEFAMLKQREQDYSGKLINNIVDKASGVFLWVRLVVSSLLAGMLQGDRVLDLQRRLDLLPPDLERLYDKMLDSIDPFYHEHAAQLFTLVRASEEPLTLALLTFVDDEAASTSLHQNPAALSAQAMEIRFDTMRRRINSRTKGLLEVTRSTLDQGHKKIDLENRTVQYLHRTVRDYMASPEVQTRIEKDLVNPFDAYRYLCVGIYALVKIVDLNLIIYPTRFIENSLRLFLGFARWIRGTYQHGTQYTNELSLVALVDGFVTVIRSHFGNLTKAVAPEQPFSELTRRIWCGLDSQPHFYHIAAHCGLSDYLSQKNLDGYIVQFQDHRRPSSVIDRALLIDALRLGEVSHTFKFMGSSSIAAATPDIKTLSYMLKHGARLHISPPDIDGIRPTGTTDLLLGFWAQRHMVKNATYRQEWYQAFALLTEYHDQIWPLHLMSRWSTSERSAYHLSLIDLYGEVTFDSRLRGFANIKGAKPSLPKLARVAPSRHAKRIHTDWLHCVQVLQIWTQGWSQQ